MRPGGGKAKGSAFERDVCVELSLWVSAGKNKDLFWRSAMSGGRATVRRGEVRQAGDITAVEAAGHVLTDRWYIECKFVKDLALVSFLLDGKGMLAEFWKVACKEAAKYDRTPVIIAKQNRLPTLLITKSNTPLYTADLDVVSIDTAIRCHIFRYSEVLAFPFKKLRF